MNKISYFKRVTEKSIKEVNITDVYNLISSGKLQAITKQIRTETDKKKRNNLKIYNLPAVTISGNFANGTHKISDFIKHSGLLQIDIDNIDNPETAKEQLVKDKYSNCCFISPSGNGVKVIVKIQADKKTHLQSFLGLQKYYIEKYNLQIDEKCKDISRLMFLCSDTNIYVNENSDTFTISKETKVSRVIQNKQQFDNDTFADVQKVINQININKIDITDGYNNWLSVGFALADTFADGGRSYFHEVSKYNIGYDQTKTDKQFDNCLKNSKNKGISPFFAIAMKYNIDTVSVKQVPTKQQGNTPEPTQEQETNILNEPIEKNSKDADKDFKDYEFYLSNGCYYTKIMVGKSLKKKRISNFVMKSLYNLDNGTNNTKRIVKLQNRNNKINLIEVRSSETKADSFETILKSKQCTFKGNAYELKSIFEYLMDNEQYAKEITSLGFQPETEIYAFADAIINTKNELKTINELGVIEDNKETYYLPAFSPANVLDDIYENERKFAYKQGDINFKTWADLFYKAYGLNGSIGTMYAILSLFRDIVFKELSFFPFLFLFGDYGVGKTQFTNAIIRMFGNFEGTDINTTTDTGLSRTVSQRINSLFYFKEFSNNTDKKIYNFVLTAYDGVGKTMGQKTVGNQTKNLKTRSGIIFDGNYLPIHKTAVYSRFIVLNFETQDFSETETKAWKSLTNHYKSGLSGVAKEILKHREYFKNSIAEKLSDNLDNINKNNDINELPARIKTHLALLIIPYQLLHKKLKFPFTLKELQEKLIEYAKEQMEVLNEIKDITIFWQAMEYAKNTTFKLQENKHYIKGEIYFYLKYNTVYPFYVEYCKNNNNNISDKESLRNLLTSTANKSFISGRTRKMTSKRPIGDCYKFMYSVTENTIKINNTEISI